MPSAAPTRRRFLCGSLAAAGLGAVALPAQAGPGILARVRAELQRVGAAVTYRDVVGVVDFSQPSREPRFHLVDTATGRVESLLVAHGRGSDPTRTGWVRTLSNTPGSNASSAGAYVTGAYYTGQHGRSMRLKGLDATNDNAEARAIVVHSARYVSPQIARLGILGRSQGCFAVARADLDRVLSRLGPGRLLIAGKFQA